MKKFWGIWLFLYLIVVQFIYQWIWNWRYNIECFNEYGVIYDCFPHTSYFLVILGIIAILGAIVGFLFWKKQNIVAKIFMIIVLVMIVYFVIYYLSRYSIGNRWVPWDVPYLGHTFGLWLNNPLGPK